jgi:hypothetical protein
VVSEVPTAAAAADPTAAVVEEVPAVWVAQPAASPVAGWFAATAAVVEEAPAAWVAQPAASPVRGLAVALRLSFPADHLEELLLFPLVTIHPLVVFPLGSYFVNP